MMARHDHNHNHYNYAHDLSPADHRRFSDPDAACDSDTYLASFSCLDLLGRMQDVFRRARRHIQDAIEAVELSHTLMEETVADGHVRDGPPRTSSRRAPRQ